MATLLPETGTAVEPTRSLDAIEELPRQRRRPLRFSLDVIAPLRQAELPFPPPVKRNTWEIRLLALVALVAYCVVGWWLRHYLHFAIGDALARTANAKYMIFSRDPHFAALGFVWMPIPTVSQIPAMLVLNPLGYASDSGWVTTAIWGALTVLILGRLGRDLELPRLTTLVIVIAYAFNPVVVYYAANGMSEGPLFTFIAMTFWGLLRYLRRGDTAALIITAGGVTGCAYDRYEAIPLIFAVAAAVLLADIRRKGRWSALMSTTLTILPGIVAVTAWFVYMKAIKGSFRAFQTDAAGNQVAAPATTVTPPVVPTPASTLTLPGPPHTSPKPIYYFTEHLTPLAYTLHWCFNYAPALFVLPLLLIPPLRRTVGALAVMTFAVWLPYVTYYLLLRGGSAGDPRYFTSVVITTTVGLLYLASRLNLKWLRLVIHPALALFLALGWVTGYHAELDRTQTSEEGEWRVFDVLHGQVNRSDSSDLIAWERFDKVLDTDLMPGDVVFTDVRYNFLAELDSDKANQFIINNDADFDAIRANPYRPGVRIDYLIVPSSGSRGDGIDYGQVILSESPSSWTQVASPGPALIYKRVAGVAGPAPAAGTEGTGITP